MTTIFGADLPRPNFTHNMRLIRHSDIGGRGEAYRGLRIPSRGGRVYPRKAACRRSSAAFDKLGNRIDTTILEFFSTDAWII